MKRNYTNRSIVFALLALIMITSCKKKFFDVNKNPNAPAIVEVSAVLPSAELAIAYVVGYEFEIYGSIWSQYWAQNPSSSQYKTIEQYAPKSDDFDDPWQILYSGALEDLNFVVQKGQAENKPQYVACAKILQAYTYQLLTDNFGDVPFSESLKGEAGNFTPKYDSQQAVYDGIISLLDNASALIDVNDPVHPGSDDIFFKGDMSQWDKFANTLKLRVYMRLSEIDPGRAQAGIQGLAGKLFLDVGENVKVDYTSAGGNTNPLYASIIALSKTQNLVGSASTVDNMSNLNDDRVSVFYLPAAITGDYKGLVQGDYDAGTTLDSLALPAPITGANANDETSALAPVKLMSDYESLFLQAEAAARGWLNLGTDEDLYQSAIVASFKAYGLDKRSVDLEDGSTIEVQDDSLAINYYSQDTLAYPVSGSLSDKLKAIVTQKWFAMAGNQGIEAWAELRRTGYPDFLIESKVSTIGSGRKPARMFYPSVELTRNPNMPGQKRIFERVWWDIAD